MRLAERVLLNPAEERIERSPLFDPKRHREVSNLLGEKFDRPKGMSAPKPRTDRDICYLMAVLDRPTVEADNTIPTPQYLRRNGVVIRVLRSDAVGRG
jgi:hypothetical protein